MANKIDAGFDEWVARELPRATWHEIDLCRTAWIAALASIPKVTVGASLLRSPAKVIAGGVPAAGRPNKPMDFRSYEKATQRRGPVVCSFGDELMGKAPPTFGPRAERRITDAELSAGTREAQDSGDGSYPDVEEPSDYCECGAVHTGLEDGGRCEACGKII